VNTTPPRHSVSVSGVIPDDHGRVLLIRRRDNQHWEPPGGVLELDEAIHDGLRREIREETGLDIEPDALTGVYKNMPRGIMEQWAFHVEPAAAPAFLVPVRETASTPAGPGYRSQTVETPISFQVMENGEPDFSRPSWMPQTTCSPRSCP